METFKLVLDLVVSICGIIPTIVAVCLLVKNIIANKNWELVQKIAQEAMTSVEEYEYSEMHPEMTSKDKLDMALEAIKAGLCAAGIKFDDALIKQIIAYIEQLIKWSKTVNTH